MRQLLVIIMVFAFLPTIVEAQKWKRQRKEITAGVGLTSFLGDLGGRDRIASAGPLDADLSAMRYSFSVGLKYRFLRKLYGSANFFYVQVSGDDNLTEEPGRKIRQLNFKSPIYELTGRAEYTLTGGKSSGSLYRLRGVRGGRGLGIETYIFAGLGAVWFDPRGKRDGKWHRLRPLHTEGQGLAGAPKQYTGISVVIPYGIGFKKKIGGRLTRIETWSIGFEITVRKTFTDYIDDVSGSYYGSDFIKEAYGDDAAYFADPSGIYTDHTTFGEPQRRGNSSDNDSYLDARFFIGYKPNKRGKRSSLPKF